MLINQFSETKIDPLVQKARIQEPNNELAEHCITLSQFQFSFKKRKEEENQTFSTGRVMKAVAMAAKRMRSRAIRKTDPHERAIDNLRRQGLQSSSSSNPAISCFKDERALSPAMFARFGFRIPVFAVPTPKNQT